MARVVLENVRVDFPIYATQRNLRTAIFNRATGGLIRRQGKNQNRVVVTALSGVSMTLEDGDRLGLIGHNGSGKSTLLKVIAGIYEPIEGRLMVEGAVTPLFDMMPGVDPEDSGYENIFTAGLLLGLSREEIESRIPQIEELSELGEYLSLPVRTYSAGMTMRLGFSLVTSCDPGILLMDEGFGTGDARFARRVEQRMNEFIARSRILVLASHSNAAIRAMCNKAALMQAGQILAVGPVDEVYEQYDALVRGAAQKLPVSSQEAAAHGKELITSAPGHDVFPDREFAADERPRPAARPMYSEQSIRNAGLENRLSRTSGAVRLTKVSARDDTGVSRWNYAPGETATFQFDYEVVEQVPHLVFLFRLYLASDEHTANAEQIVTDVRETLSYSPLEVGHKGRVELMLPNLKLMPNTYCLYVCLTRADSRGSYDVIDQNIDLPAFVIASTIDDNRVGIVSLDYGLQRIDVSQSDTDELRQRQNTL